MSTTATTTVLTRDARGRTLTRQSVAMSRQMVIMKFRDKMGTTAIANFYNKQKRRIDAGKTLSPNAVGDRILKYAAKFPADYAAIVGGNIPATAPTFTVEFTNVKEAELVAA